MPIEPATYIDDLNTDYPESDDGVAQGDDHLRLIKQVLKNTFPNITGPVTANQGEINVPVPPGIITAWYGAQTNVPTGWALCDGSTYARSDGGGNITTPDLSGSFIKGWTSGTSVGDSGGGSTINSTDEGVGSGTEINVSEPYVVLAFIMKL